MFYVGWGGYENRIDRALSQLIDFEIGGIFHEIGAGHSHDKTAIYS